MLEFKLEFWLLLHEVGLYVICDDCGCLLCGAFHPIGDSVEGIVVGSDVGLTIGLYECLRDEVLTVGINVGSEVFL